VSTRAIDINLAKHGELDTVLGCKLLDLSLWLWFLLGKLVARKGQNFKSLRLVRVVQGDEFLVVLVGQASFRRHVDHQRHLSNEFGEVPGLPIDVHGTEIAKKRHGSSASRSQCEPGFDTCVSTLLGCRSILAPGRSMQTIHHGTAVSC